MSKTFTAVYEHGLLRPREPLDLEEGVEVEVALLDRNSPSVTLAPAEILAEIAALPVEGAGDPDTAREHDRYLYGSKGGS